jgi:MoaA/NifB/PqqE/SkfB family radical SAM enzyme
MRSTKDLIRDAKMVASRRLNRSLAPPDRVSLNVTLRCNLKCTMCTTCYDSPEMSLIEIKDIIDQTAAWGVEVFNPLGGEPFMRSDIEEILAYAVRRGFYVTVTTNGTLITDKRAQAIARIPADKLHFNFSLDGAREAHDAIRSAGMWARAIEGFQRIREADAAAGNARRKILANTILHARNVAGFHDVLDEQAALGFDGVQILNLFRQGPAVPPQAANLWFQEAHQSGLVSMVESLARRVEAQGAVGYRIQNTAEQLRRIPAYYSDTLGPLEAPCWAGWKELYINADGAAIMCDGELDFLKGRFGNIRESTLQALWNSPALRTRREVVKQCTTPCVQGCYLRPESDSVREISVDAGRIIARRVRERTRLTRRVSAHHPDAVLCLELSDVCPCDWPECPEPVHRWRALVAGSPVALTPNGWAEARDRGYLDFGRGFMGFEVVRSIIDDLRAARLRFGTVSVRWRGEPLLHPEAGPILGALMDAIGAGAVADGLRVETDGRFLTEDMARLAGRPVPQTWVLQKDRASAEVIERALELLETHRGEHCRLIVATTATADTETEHLSRWLPQLPRVAGRFPEAGDALWIRRLDGATSLANKQARAELQRVASTLGLSAELGEERSRRQCRAPRRTPTISWDGKVALCPQDTQLQQVVGDVISSSFSEAWSGALIESAHRATETLGVPTLPKCSDCPWPWSPNHPS